jgi:hypothetical protein
MSGLHWQPAKQIMTVVLVSGSTQNEKQYDIAEAAFKDAWVFTRKPDGYLEVLPSWRVGSVVLVEPERD